MKATLSTATFLNELQTAARIASSRSAVQALSGVQLEADSDGVELRATDMEVGLRLKIQARDFAPGSVVLPARLLLDVVRSLPTAELTLELRSDEQDVELISGTAVFNLRTLRNDDFPRLPQAPVEGSVVLSAAAFIDTVARVARSASRDDTRPVLTGILVSAEDSSLRMVATDSYRLSVKTTTLDTPVSAAFEANVPARALQELARIAQQTAAEQIAVAKLDSQVVFSLGDGAPGAAILSSRLIDGQFPNFQQLLPESTDHELRVGREELADVVRRISLLALKNAPLRLGFAPGELRVSAQTPDVGEAHETLAVPFQGEPFDIGFNPEFLRDGLESVEASEILIKLTSPLRPGLIESADGSGFVYLVMPIRLGT
ncbi:MAG TPA: DNA polymerase III subunit beta [Solirubrobacteraceae bacterium]|nr:DNA polymerase III subunit beta [Solirubrobacteraceae bacterium]